MSRGQIKPTGTFSSAGREHLRVHIKRWWEDNQAEFSRHLNVTAVNVNRLLNGRIEPTLRTAFAIEKLSATKGDTVFAREWLEEP